MTETTTTEDIRVAAFRLGAIARGFNEDRPISAAYKILESPAYTAHDLAVRVFAALNRNEWGVADAFSDGLNGGVVAGLNGTVNR